jgi:hypothetical protein
MVHRICMLIQGSSHSKSKSLIFQGYFGEHGLWVHWFIYFHWTHLLSLKAFTFTESIYFHWTHLLSLNAFTFTERIYFHWTHLLSLKAFTQFWTDISTNELRRRTTNRIVGLEVKEEYLHRHDNTTLNIRTCDIVNPERHLFLIVIFW